MKSRFSSSISASVCLALSMSMFVGIILTTQMVLGSSPAGRTGYPLSSSERSAYEQRKALEAYEKRNAEIDSWIEDDSIPDYENAALLYYQALLLRPDHDQTVINKFYDVYGIKPDTQIRTFLGEWLPSMKVAEIASRIPQCNWEIWRERVWPEEKRSHIFLITSFRHFSHIIAVDGITLASDGNNRAALERCMTLRRIARHLSYDSALHLLSNNCDGTALKAIRRILFSMPLDTDVLTWFQEQLEEFQEPTTFVERNVQEYLKADIDTVHSSSIARLRGMLLKSASDEQGRQNIRVLSDNEIRDQTIKAIQEPYDSISAILKSDKSAEQKKEEIEEITNIPINEVTNSPVTEDIIESLLNIHKSLGDGTIRLMTGIDIQPTKGQKLAEIQRIIDRSAEPNTVELLTRFSIAVGKEVDFGFLTSSELTVEQKRARMKKVIDELNEAYAIETEKSPFGFPWKPIESMFESQVSHTAHINSIKIAVELYLIMAKTGQLPRELPDYLPKDPYTNRPFFYKITEDCFDLGCRSDVFKRGKQLFTFSVPEQGG